MEKMVIMSDRYTVTRPCSPDEVPVWARNGTKGNNRKFMQWDRCISDEDFSVLKKKCLTE